VNSVDKMKFVTAMFSALTQLRVQIIRGKLLSRGIFYHTLKHNKAYEKQHLTLTWFLRASVSIWLSMATKTFSRTRSVLLSSLAEIGYYGQCFKMIGRTNLVSNYKSERGANYSIKSHLEWT